MSKIYRTVILLAVLLLLVGCSQHSFGGNLSDVERVEDSSIVRTLQYLDDNTEGPEYELSLTLPDEWVGEYETLNRGNSLVFRRLSGDEDDPKSSVMFYVDALSNAQYWEQIGSYPGQYFNLLNTADTYFVYHFPLEPYYTGLSEEEYDAFTAEVPTVVSSLQVSRVN